jgi:hypothetical protein
MTTEPEAITTNDTEAHVLKLFEQASDLSEKGIRQQYDKWKDRPKTVGKARKNWPLFMGAVLASHRYCGIESPKVAADAIVKALADRKTTLQERENLLAFKIPQIWGSDQFKDMFRRELPTTETTKLERVILRFMKWTGANRAAVEISRQRGDFGAGGRDHMWIVCVLRETSEYAEAIKDLTDPTVASAVYQMRRELWTIDSQEDHEILLGGDLPPAWIEAAPAGCFEAAQQKGDSGRQPAPPPEQPPPARTPGGDEDRSRTCRECGKEGEIGSGDDWLCIDCDEALNADPSRRWRRSRAARGSEGGKLWSTSIRRFIPEHTELG